MAGCIPIEGDVSVSSWPQLTSAAAPLQPQEAIVILGTSASEDGDLPACVRKVLSEVSPGTRMVESKVFRAKVGGLLAQANALVKEEEVEAELQANAVQRAIAELAVRYLVLVDGETTESNFQSSGGTMGVAANSVDRQTHIDAVIWDAPTTGNIGSISTNSSGSSDVTVIGVIGIWEYSPTESIACESMAGEIQRLLASGYTPPSS